MKPEEKSRIKIDELLELSGWSVVDVSDLDSNSNKAFAIREVSMKDGTRADYILYYKYKVLAILEAKKFNNTLSGVEEQSENYANNIPDYMDSSNLFFIYESNGYEIRFRDKRDEESRSRTVFGFHKPDTLLSLATEDTTLRNRLKHNMPEIDKSDLRDCQYEAILKVEESLKNNCERTLLQMATGAGKTRTSINLFYRLLKYANAKRILFLVDRNNLGEQAESAFNGFKDNGREFKENYTVQRLQNNIINENAHVVITTIQRLYSILNNDNEYDNSLDDKSSFERDSQNIIREVKYNSKVPIETFDFIFIDECHRSIYGEWQMVLKYFDAFIIGLTATPSKHTIGFFNKNLVYEYSLERSIIDGVNVDCRVFRIKTEISEKGALLEENTVVPIMDKGTRREIYEKLEDDIKYEKKDLDRKVISKNQIRTILQAYKDSVFTQLYPNRKGDCIPKTLIFAKDDNHAENIVEIAREVFVKGNDFCRKITYTSTDPKGLIREFNNSVHFRIAVSVDMISTGSDIQSLEVLIFMRNISSEIYYEQMKGRGVRTIDKEVLKVSTPNALEGKDFYYLIDAIGITENTKSISTPLENKETRSISTEKLLERIALGDRSEKTLRAIVGRMSTLNKKISKKDIDKLREVSPNKKTLLEITNDIYNTVDYDIIANKEEVEIMNMRNDAVAPLCNSKYRNELLSIFNKSYYIIDNVNPDKVIFTDFSLESAAKLINSFTTFISSNKDSIEALSFIYSKNYKISYSLLYDLQEKLFGFNHQLKIPIIWENYYLVDKERVKSKRVEDILCNLIQLVRFAIGNISTLEDINVLGSRNFEFWKGRQKRNYNIEFDSQQSIFLEELKKYILYNGYIHSKKEINSALEDIGGYKRFEQLFIDFCSVSNFHSLEDMLDDLSLSLIS